MNLVKELRSAGYDQIESPIRNHKPLQLWLKRPKNKIQLYAEHISDALNADVELRIIEDDALSVSYSDKQDYDFNMGINILEGVLSSLNLGKLGLAAKLGHGKKVTMSYNNTKTLIVPLTDLSKYLSQAEFPQANDFIKDANRDNFIVITGILTAKDFISTIETDTDISAGLAAELTEIGSGEVDFSKVGNKKLEMKAEGNIEFPIAVNAHKIDWDRGKYTQMTLVTDNRCFF